MHIDNLIIQDNYKIVQGISTNGKELFNSTWDFKYTCKPYDTISNIHPNSVSGGMCRREFQM